MDLDRKALVLRRQYLTRVRHLEQARANVAMLEALVDQWQAVRTSLLKREHREGQGVLREIGAYAGRYDLAPLTYWRTRVHVLSYLVDSYEKALDDSI